MTQIRSTNEIILSLIDFFRIAQPLLDTKPGSVARDLVIDGPAAQLSRLYDELNRVSSLQSLRLALGADLDRLAQNFGATRNRGSKATGLALLTFNSLDVDFAVNKGDQIFARNNITFLVLNPFTVNVTNASAYKAIASKYRADLDFVGISDQYAIEVLTEASVSGTQGNISKYSLSDTSIAGISNVTNASPFSGGKSSEDDASFRSRILAIFSGANTGTELGYRNAVKADSAVVDAVVITPGDSLMTRDGTQVSIASDGTRTITSEGTGGKIDILVFGSRLQEDVDSVIYRDLSNTDDPTNEKNDFVLGQISGDENKTVTRKRLDNLETGILPSQPINNIVSVSGSISGSNYVEKTVDDLGRISGNYELIRDTGAYGGSPWGFDRLRWISDRIKDFPEDKTKISFNGQDTLSFPDVLEITAIQQNIPVVNENSKVSLSDRSSIQLAHFPITNVTRVFNVTTGERYVVSNQNPDGSGSTNETGRIIISGKSLPAVSDILQVDYTWVYSYDPYFDFDNRTAGTNNPRSVTDSVDWGFSNAVRRERVTLMTSGSYLTATVTHPITSVISVNVFESDVATVGLSNGRLSAVTQLTINNVISATRVSDGAELWLTSDLDGTFSGSTLFFPTDSPVAFGDSVTIVYNGTDVYNADTQGSFSDNKITIVSSSDATAGVVVECTYISNVSTILPSTSLASLPAIRSNNTFTTNVASGIGNQPTTHLFSGNAIVGNLRQAPTNLAFTIAGSISSGVITVTGTSISFINDIVFTVSSNGLKQDLSSAIKNFLALSSKESVPSNIKVVRITKVEKVTTTSNLDVLEVDHEYDIKGYKLLDNSYVKSESVLDSALKSTELTLPSTADNVINAPVIGDRIRIRFYISTSSDSENISFSRSGTLYTNKKFLIVNTIAISSGFTSASSASATLTVNNLNQPTTRSRYKTFYDYLAPKTNERITIRYNYDKLMSDATLAVEEVRPINADVLVKAATPVQVDVTMVIVVSNEFKNSAKIVEQNVKDALTSALNATALGTTVDQSDLIATAYTVTGVDRARITFFNKSDETGSVLSITAQKNEFITVNAVTVTSESR